MTEGEREALKRAAARRALAWVEEGMAVGLGTGSTVRYVLEELAAGRAEGRWRDLRCVATSRATEELAHALALPLVTLDDAPELDLAIDGADEIDPERRLLKGGGGALLREKIVAACARRLVIVADRTKAVARLGERHPVPVEIDPFAVAPQIRYLESLGASRVELRRDGAGRPFRTDGGHAILDATFPAGLAHPEELARRLADRPGVLEHGLFLDFAPTVVLAHGPTEAETEVWA